MVFLRHIETPYKTLAVHWLGPKTIVTIDSTEMMHLTDVRTTRELESLDVAGAGLVYGSAQFKGYATGGNVSPALALAGNHACYNSVVSVGSQLYILGARSVHSISVRSWHDRITHLVHNQKWADVFQIALEGYRNTVERPHRRQAVKDRIIRVIDDYLVATESCPEMCLASVMSCLIEINAHDLLWQELWERLQNTENYLVLLTQHIENGSISYISPRISQALCDYWIDRSTKRFENIILKLSWECLDLHQVLSAVKSHDMYIAQMHLNTSALGDYCISITDLIPKIKSESNRDLGNFVLVYISSCLSGRRYPCGEIHTDLVAKVKHEVKSFFIYTCIRYIRQNQLFNFLLLLFQVLRCLTSVHSNHADATELTYPYLRSLLQFDTRETLNVISLAFHEIEFQGQLGRSHRQRIVNILLEIMVPEHFAVSFIIIYISTTIPNK